MIRVENLVKHFGRTRAVDGISFEVQPGEVVGFLGPNGAGKTTTLRVLTCYHPASRGLAEVAGHDVRRASVPVRRSVGYLPENVPIYPDLRVEEYLQYRAALKGVPKRERRAAVEHAMERCDITDVRRKLVGHVSRGYRQRVGLADALVARPPILILDEPTAGLDPNQRRRIKALVRDLAADHTVLFSSHILPEVQDVSSRILVIHRGTIRADGTPQELLELSRGRRLVVTAALLGADLCAALRGMAGVGEPQIVAEEGKYRTAEVPVDAHADPRDEAFTRLAAAGAALRELRLELPTLEDCFQQLTEGADEAQAATSGDGEEAA
ncbi:MAG: ABC transporter ATP-binding protein [Planctomycetota bacterium]